MTSQALNLRAWNKWRRFTIDRFGRRQFGLNSDLPFVSFTFDDFPRSALIEGGSILTRNGVRGTYFVSLQLLGRSSPSGPIASQGDLQVLLNDGHELGCHTFEHLDGTQSTAEEFESSIAANRAALTRYAPGHEFSMFAYPLNGPVLCVKKAVGRHFIGCRGGGQTFNSGAIDLNLLKSYFLDRRNRGDLHQIRTVIEQNAAARGWLIFSTHDVAAAPSEYGCEPEFFEEVVRLSIQSGARIVPMVGAWRELSQSSANIDRNRSDEPRASSAHAGDEASR